MDLAHALQWLYGTQLFGIKLGLDNMRRLAAALGVDLARPRFLHVAGTNGKGSVCAFAESLARTAGLRTGLFTSPHLVTFRERIRIDGRMIAPAAAADGLARIRRIVTGWDPHPTFFEITTALALRAFEDAGTDFVVLETGMGGRLDATNAVLPAACAITPVDLDHQLWLGSTTAAIAAEKAGILKPAVPAVSSPQSPEVADVIRRRAAEVAAPLAFVEAPLPADWETGIPGPHNRTNAAVALAAVRAAGVGIPDADARRAIAETRWPGRFQAIRDGRVIVDGAHNPSAARALVATWRERFGRSAFPVIVFGAVSTKDVEGMIDALSAIASAFVFTRPDSERALDPATFRAPVPSVVEPDAASAVERALSDAPGDPPVLVAGSLYLVGEVLSRFGDGAGAGHRYEPSLQ